MAKSIRSKWKRKCRAIKRERYAVKELARLKKMLGIKEEEKTTEEVMESEQVIYLDAGEIGKRKKKEKPPPDVEEDVEMSSDDENVEVSAENGEKKIYSSKTLKDQNGQYPVWLHKRKIAKLNKVGKKNTKKRMKKRRR
ncbi:PREDICTED: protein LLP homolog [Papilio polytes]|uniref:protein LLP homolog n=1 Tax=Papilio polytes TaxID=76194 RepID=UPI000675F523|nr:PREDICTED: protein LLP homolog [Papilio polytes]